MSAKYAHPIDTRFTSCSGHGAGDSTSRADDAKRAGHPLAASSEALVANMLVLASRIEPDPMAVSHWYRETSIAALDHLTARALVAQGRAGEVLAFLRAILEQGD